MTEAEWLACANPSVLLTHAVGRVSERKLRLFGAACCRLVGGRVTDGPFVQTVEAIERYADTRKSKAALRKGRQAVRALRYGLRDSVANWRTVWVACWLAEVAAAE